MKIASFNINNIRRRLPNLVDWLRSAKPDVACLQELKATDREFPADALRKAGYEAVWRGEKTWNGVAILARGVMPVVTRTELPGDPDDTPEPLYRGRGQRRADRLALCAERQSAARAEIRLQARLVQAADAPCRVRSTRPASRSCSRATTTWCRPRRISTRPNPTTTTRCCSRKAAPPTAPARARLDRCHPRAASGRADVYVLGLHAEALGARRRAAARSDPAERRPARAPGRGRGRSRRARPAGRQRSCAGVGGAARRRQADREAARHRRSEQPPSSTPPSPAPAVQTQQARREEPRSAGRCW